MTTDPVRPPGGVRRGWRHAWIAVGVCGLLVVGIVLVGALSGRLHGNATQNGEPATQSSRTVSGGGSPIVTGSPSTATAGAYSNPVDPYQKAIDTAAAHGLRVWVEADLVKRWLAGKAQFAEGVRRLAQLATRPGVIGFKVADELGYNDGTTSADQVLSFLQDTATALRAAAPGKKILIDMLIPELGCLPGVTPEPVWASVAAAQSRGKYPQLAIDQVDRYVRSGTFDVLDISTGLLEDRTYVGWGTDRDTAQHAGWAEVRRLDWAARVTLHARKAMAQADGWSGSVGQADAELRTWIDIPLQDGAQAVDVWTWAQRYQGRVYALLGADAGTTNPLWDGLVRRRASGRALFTHLTPSLTRQNVNSDLTRVATAFTDVFIAAGTG